MACTSIALLMARTKAFFFTVSVAWIFLVLASRGLVTLPEVQEVASAPEILPQTNESISGASESLLKAMNSQRNPAQVIVKAVTSPALQWSIEPLSAEDHTLLKK